METIRENLAAVHAVMEEACKKVGRDPKEVTLLAVSKTKPMELLKEAYEAGERSFGENYVQELTEKIKETEEDPPYTALSGISWHMIGHLQRNKVKYIVDKVDMIHSVDSLRLAEQIEHDAEKKGVIANILLEVNIAGEESKWGFTAAEGKEAALSVAKDLPHVRVRGFMTSAPYTEDPESNRVHFRNLKALFDETAKLLAAEGAPDAAAFDTLSMGMTGDYRVAIEEGATIVRVGTGIFGARDYSH
ncbi:MAG: YggS family pyridoxal phosphate-dependent enzyme [Lachnospiraceae bacterium]|nr:YggS family pyridoxal phosphate-dependent enzyme [Lachnospiraceae bacterium]